jgi:hypothetical protein
MQVDHEFKVSLGYIARPSLKNQGLGCSSVEKYLSSVCKALILIPRTPKKIFRRRKKGGRGKNSLQRKQKRLNTQ